jgi:hypothetical protein
MNSSPARAWFPVTSRANLSLTERQKESLFPKPAGISSQRESYRDAFGFPFTSRTASGPCDQKVGKASSNKS